VARVADTGRRGSGFSLVRRQPRSHDRGLVIGTDPLSSGARIVNTHNDSITSPLKPKPFRGLRIQLLDTVVHGG
jgi:hypothetical protein